MQTFKYGNDVFTFKPRTSAVTKVCGEYSITNKVVEYHARLLKARIQEEGQQHPVKVTQKSLNSWLMEMGEYLGMEETQIRGVIETLDVKKFTVSCRPADIYRIGISKHYKACTRPGEAYARYLSSYLCNQDLAVVFVRDSGGFYKHRMLLGVKEVKGRTVFYTARVYGSTELMTNCLKELCVKHNAVIGYAYNEPSPMTNVDTLHSLCAKDSELKNHGELLTAPAGSTVFV